MDFRRMRRFHQAISIGECESILTQEPRGVMAVYGEEGYPYAFPMNYVYDKEDKILYFHTAKSGHKIEALTHNNNVSFCVYDKGFVKEGEWALNIKSVIVFGQVELVNDINKTKEIVRRLGIKYYPSAEEVDQEIDKAIQHVQLLALHIDHMSGKLINES